MTAQLKDEGDATTVVITTDLAISGRAAQFGRGVLADVSGTLIAQFARSLEAELLGGAALRPPRRSPRAATAAAQPADSVDPAEGDRGAGGEALRTRRCRSRGRRCRRSFGGAAAQAHRRAAHGVRRTAGPADPVARVKAAPFTYHRAESVKEASDVLAEFGDEAKVLAGGQSLIPLLAYG